MTKNWRTLEQVPAAGAGESDAPIRASQMAWCCTTDLYDSPILLLDEVWIKAVV